MKTISTLFLTALVSLGATTATAQGRDPHYAPYGHSSYYRSPVRGNRPSTHYDGRSSHSNWYDYGRHRYSSGYFGSHATYGYDSYLSNCPVTFRAGLVSKRFSTFFGPGDRCHENIWGQEGRFMNGLQMGVGVQPSSYNGLGLYTGLFYEIYFASGAGVRDLGFNRFTEHDLYLPLHFAYSFPVASYVDIDFSTGLGFNVALAGVYRSWGRYGSTDYQDYGNYNRPDRANVMWEFGANVRYSNLKVGASFGLGLNDHEFYDNARTRQNKFSLSVGYEF